MSMKNQNQPISLIKILILAQIILFPLHIIAIELSPSSEHSIFKHLLEVNQEWANQTFDLSELSKEISFNNDKERIQLHLKTVVQILRSKQSNHLSKAQKLARENCLDILNAYWTKGQFPINKYHQERKPYFIDDFGTACAVGHLAIATNEYDLAHQIAHKDNYAYIHELNYPALNDWAKANGFTMEELAWIQPSYPPLPKPFTPIGDNLGCDGRINVMKVNNEGTLLYIAGNFTEFDGRAANSIIAFDGENYIDIGGSLCGEIYDIAFDNADRVYVGGEFDFCDGQSSVNFARWNVSTWEFDFNSFDGPVYSLCPNGSKMVVGGDFSQINDLEFSNLAFCNTTGGNWSNNGYGNGGIVEGAFSVNGPVRKIIKNDYTFLIGGTFTLTGNSPATPGVNVFETNNLAYWFGNNWVSGIDEALKPIHSMAILNGDLWVGGNLQEENSFAKLSAGLWTYYNPDAYLYEDNGNNLVYGFIQDNDNAYAYGAMDYIGNYHGSGLIDITTYPHGGAVFNDVVTTAAVFKNELYLAGDFTTVRKENEYLSMNNITKISNALTDVVETIKYDPIQVYFSNDQINVEYDELKEDALLSIYNLQGQFIQSLPLNAGSGQVELPCDDYPKGTFVYQIQSKSFQQSNKIAIY